MSIQTFFGWWQLMVCLFAAAGLLSIWWHLGRRQGDRGQVWLALSVGCWGISGGLEILHAHEFIYNTLVLNGLRSILSLLNSFFILLALPWFRHIPKSISFLVQSRAWFFIIFFPFLICLFATLAMFFSTEISPRFINSLDVLYALVPTLPFLGWILWESFAKRQLKLLSWLSLLGIGFIVAAQILKLFSFENEVEFLLLFSSVFKTTLIMLFFALAMSWVKELSEHSLLTAKQLHLTLNCIKNEAGKVERQVFLKGYPAATADPLLLSRASFTLLLEFTKRKIAQPDDWLTIKPKRETRPNQTYDINDHNQIKRIVTALLDQLHGKDNWTMPQHYEPLRHALFQTSSEKERRIQLALPIENVMISEEALLG